MSSELMLFAEKLARLLDPKNEVDSAVVQKGLNLHRQDLVYGKTESPDEMKATIQDVIPVQVSLNLLDPASSTCECDPEGFCRHKLALFFSSYSEVASISDWLRSWRSNSPIPKKPAIGDLPIQRASDLLKARQAIQPEKSYDGWKKFVQNNFEDHLEPHLNLPGYVVEDKINTFMKKLKAQEPFEREWKTLYSFVVNFAVLRLLVDILQKDSYQQSVLRALYAFADDMMEELHHLLQHLGRQARPFAFDPFFVGIRNDVPALLSGKDGLDYEKTEVYRAIWSLLLTKSNWRQEERSFIKERLESGELNGAEITAHKVAAIHLALLTSHQDEAEKILQGLDSDACPYMFYWLNYLAENDSDYRSAAFIEFLNSHIREYIKGLRDYYRATDFVRTFTSQVSSYCYRAKRLDLLERFYRESLPYSYWNYANFLFEQGSYKKWVEMHIYSEISIDVISTENIKKVVAEDPSLVLPLYYHAVQDNVSMKNRSAYKQAVRYLKKMRTIYKKLKKEDFFHDYVAHLSESTKRLRAFQEELKRGKLIDA
ncbi:hypothetical protein [Peribacillus sp. SCS-155]|uniref:hypothetical protein n=1 Tax=Peribacillus sedimenti TaxID=3115297 RepID=UPI0039067921